MGNYPKALPQIQIIINNMMKLYNTFGIKNENVPHFLTCTTKSPRLRKELNNQNGQKSITETVNSASACGFTSDSWDEENWLNQGTVVRLADGIAFVEGMSKVTFGELVGIRVYEGIYRGEKLGMVLDLKHEEVGIAILGSMDGIEEGATATRKGRVASVFAGYWALGRMVDALGIPLDRLDTSDESKSPKELSNSWPAEKSEPGGSGGSNDNPSYTCLSKSFARKLKEDKQYKVVGEGQTPVSGEFVVSNPTEYSILRPIEYRSPSILERQPVYEPVCTGITAIDALIPVGRGQRELIIDDRKTGKTSIALDAIIQQGKILRSSPKEDLTPYDPYPSMLCVYNAVGQKMSSTSATLSKLDEFGAMKNTIVLASPASDPAFKYLAPYSATALAEHFMYEGEAVLIIYDDLTRQAEAYREISLLLGRAPGREAYPGDIFYLHSRLLERSAKLGAGGSITAFPIIETLEGDVSAYLPTNVISITDGQIFLSSARFNAGFLPAINIGISVSRVGSSAQTKLLKTVTGSAKLYLAQYQELQGFAKFADELDKGTRAKIARGEKLEEILRQRETSPL